MTEKQSYPSPEGNSEPKLSVQQEFLIVAKERGVFDLLDERRRILLDTYYNTSASQMDLKKIAGVNQSRVHLLIKSGLTFLRDALPPDIQEQFPAEALKRRKPLPLESRERIGATSKGRKFTLTEEQKERWRTVQLGKTKSSEVRANMSEGQKRYWRERREREKQETVIFDNSSNQL